MFLRKYWLPLAVFIVALVGVGLYYLQTRPAKPPIVIVKPVEVEKQQPQPPAKVPVGDTSQQGGHFHADGTWHAETHAPQVASSPVSPDGQIATPAGADRNQLSPEERRKRFRDTYYAKWGDEPSWDGEYRHVYDKKGRIRRHYRNRTLMTNYETRIGFAPSPNVLQQYQQLQTEYHRAEHAGDTKKTETLLAEMQEMVDNYQGELPARPYAYATYGKFSPEDGIPYKEEATREVYQLMGIEHLFEFYENQFFNNDK